MTVNMAGKGIVVTVHISGARETIEAFRRLPKEADTQLRDASQRIATALEGPVKTAAVAEGGQAAAVAGTVKAVRGQFPMIQAGGSGRVGRHGAPAYGLLLGSEFGASRRFGWYAQSKYRSSRARQFKPHQGAHSYWFFRTVGEHDGMIAAQWRKAADDIVRSFAGGG